MHARARKVERAEPVGRGTVDASCEDGTPIDRRKQSFARRPRIDRLARLLHADGDLPQRTRTGIEAGARTAVEAVGS